MARVTVAPVNHDQLCFDPMPWTVPLYSTTDVNAAGRAYVDPTTPPAALPGALAVINNWRSAHSFPLNTIQAGLRVKARAIDPSCLVAQRIKRLSSIEDKLRRFPTMRLSQMQDLGGCRAVLSDIGAVDEMVAAYKRSNHKHKLERSTDYISSPQPSGYRGVHLIYRYHSDRNATYNDQKIEIQIRSQLQHAWATAVETVGTFIRQALKSSRGHADWLRFFGLMGSAIAIREGSPLVPGTPTDVDELITELRGFAERLDVQNRLSLYGAALTTVETTRTNSQYYLLHLGKV